MTANFKFFHISSTCIFDTRHPLSSRVENLFPFVLLYVVPICFWFPKCAKWPLQHERLRFYGWKCKGRYISRDVTKYIGNPPLVVEKSENVANFCTPVWFLEKILISLFKDIDKFYASKPNLVSMWPPNGPKIHWSAKIGFISHKGGFPIQYNIFSDIPWYPPLRFLP